MFTEGVDVSCSMLGGVMGLIRRDSDRGSSLRQCGGLVVKRWTAYPRDRGSNHGKTWTSSGTLLSVPRLTRSLALVHPDRGKEASHVSLLYFGHVKEPMGLFKELGYRTWNRYPLSIGAPV